MPGSEILLIFTHFWEMHLSGLRERVDSGAGGWACFGGKGDCGKGAKRGGRKGFFVVLKVFFLPDLLHIFALSTSCHGRLPPQVQGVSLLWDGRAGRGCFLSTHSHVFSSCSGWAPGSSPSPGCVRDSLVFSDANGTSHHVNVLFTETRSLTSHCFCFLFLTSMGEAQLQGFIQSKEWLPLTSIHLLRSASSQASWKAEAFLPSWFQPFQRASAFVHVSCL